jgi:hypothetical protein
MPNQPAPLPSTSRPVLNGNPMLLASPVNIPDFSTDIYAEYINAVTALTSGQVDQSYGRGVAVGYGLLTGGATPDFAIGCFAARCLAARTPKKSATLGTGAMDIFRLLTQYNLDVAAVVALAGQ